MNKKYIESRRREIREILPDFDADAEKEYIIGWIKEYFVKNGVNSKAVIGISGGKDSSVAAALCVEALGADRVIGVLMPQDYQDDIDDSFFLCEHLGIEYKVINIGPIYDELENAFTANTSFPISQQIKTNAPSRLRMTILYMVAAAVGGRVVNTCNYSEDYVGYSTKYGDAAGDFSPLSWYTVSEVLMIGDSLNLPEQLIYKTPADGMCGKTDEENLGFTYFELDNYILNNCVPGYEILKEIEERHQRNLHKTRRIPFCPRKTPLHKY